MEQSFNNFKVFAQVIKASNKILLRTETKKIVFNFITDEHLPVGISADEKRLRQVLLNLLGNAIKFTDRGQVDFEINLLGYNQKNNQAKIRFIVTDTGVGMTAEQLEKIFLLFEQVGSQSKQLEGTGLGLAICRQIVQMMGSEIQVKSVLGVGSTFWFEVDLSLSDQWMNSAAVSKQGKIIGYSGKRKIVLVVDDRLVNRTVVSEVLTPLGFMVIEAEHGREGLKQLEAFSPDLVITDIIMLEMDGYEFARKVRESYSQAIPILAASASVSLADQSLAIAAGCNEFLEKPLNLETLLQRLQKHLNLQWIYQPSQRATVDPEPEVIFPETEELEQLHQAVKIGDIEVIEEEAQRLKAQEPKYTIFCDRLLSLAAEFDERGMIELLERKRT